jgi:uncharacterized protein (TIGR02147 family)
MIFEHTNYRNYLKELLAERIQKNPAYSLRAMAQNLGLVNSQLSEVINGKANLSLTNALKVAHKLGLSDSESEYFCWLLQLEAESDLVAREVILGKVNRLRQAQVARPMHDLTVDQFKQISDWHHSAILELVSLDGFELSPENVAEALGISKLDAGVAIDRLERLELIERSESGSYRRVHQALVVRSPVQNAAMRNFYRQMMQKASDALESQTPDQRLSGYETLTFSSEALPEAREAIDQFFDEMIRISRKYPRKTEVYHLLVHFFNLIQGSGQGQGSKTKKERRK